jgi:hypothetical protein
MGERLEARLQLELGPTDIVNGPDGNLWFIETSSFQRAGNTYGLGSTLSEMTPDGVTTTLPYSVLNLTSDGTALYFFGADPTTLSPAILRYVPGDGNEPVAVVDYNSLGIYNVSDLAVNPSNGDLLFTGDGFVYEITLSGTLIRQVAPPFPQFDTVTADSSGNIWLWDDVNLDGFVTRIDPSGTVTNFALSYPGPYPPTPVDVEGLVVGSNGLVYVTDPVHDTFAEFDPAGNNENAPVVIPLLSLPSGSHPYGITFGPDGNLWIAENGTDSIWTDGNDFPIHSIVLNSVSTMDSNELTVNYTVNTDLQSDGVNSFEIDIYRSDSYNYDPTAVQVASYQVTGTYLNEGSQTITINSTDPNSVWGMNANTLAAPLAPDSNLPYVLAVADPNDQLPADVTTNSIQAFFEIHTIAAVTYGQEFPFSGPPAWMQSIVSGLTQEGYDAVLPVYWSSFPPAPEETQYAGSVMYHQIISAAENLAAGLDPNDIIDVQLIGHSRGASVIGVAMQDLVADPPSSSLQLQRGYYEMTFLDPHPANAATVGDVSLVSLAGSSLASNPAEYAEAVIYLGYVLASALANDPPITVPSRVNQVQDYYQTNPTYALSLSSLKNSPWEAAFNLGSSAESVGSFRAA